MATLLAEFGIGRTRSGLGRICWPTSNLILIIRTRMIIFQKLMGSSIGNFRLRGNLRHECSHLTLAWDSEIWLERVLRSLLRRGRLIFCHSWFGRTINCAITVQKHDYQNGEFLVAYSPRGKPDGLDSVRLWRGYTGSGFEHFIRPVSDHTVVLQSVPTNI